MTGSDPAKTGNSNSLVREFEVLNRYGMHARPAALFVKTAARFICDILVEKDGAVVSGKSIMGLLTLEGHQGAFLKVTASGEDAAEAMEALQIIFENKFYED
jgi:phosphocarrier protein